jgi:CBS domain containing-hemolysin-like protein
MQIRSAGRVMVPRVDVVTVRADEPAVRVVELLDTGHTRFPVLGFATGEVMGVVSIADVVGLDPAARHTTPAGAVAGPATLVAETTSVATLPERLRRCGIACVVDGRGGFVGLISLEDVAAALIHDSGNGGDPVEPIAVRAPDGSWLVPGRWRPDQVAEATGVALPDDHVHDTVSGMVLRRLGRPARPGDEVEVELPSGRARLRVERVRHRVPAEVRLVAEVGVP